MDELYQIQAEVVVNEEIAPSIFRMTLAAPEIADRAAPGQFVMVRPGPDLDPLLPRPFSIYQVTSGGWVQIVYKVVGKGTRLLAGIPRQARVQLVGPLGRGFSLPDGHRFCLVGGGMGIAPLFFAARELVRRHQDVTVLLGARTSNELAPFAEDFRLLGLIPLLATDDGSMGKQGLVVDLFDDLAHDRFLVRCCGPYPMMRAVVERCRALDFDAEVSLETMMACGVGACMGCAVANGTRPDRYLHVCKDGPVFQAEELAWR